MRSILRFIARWGSLAGLLLLLAAAVFFQFWSFYRGSSRSVIEVYYRGVFFGTDRNDTTVTDFRRLSARSPADLLARPRVEPVFGIAGGRFFEGKGILVPWWLLLNGWGLLTAMIGWLTRRRTPRGAFPVGPPTA